MSLTLTKNTFDKFYYENGWEENDILIAKI